MTLARLLLAFAPVAALFVLAAWLANRRLVGGAVLVCLGEALALTLLATLWFASLGRGGWAVLFLLLGTLVSGAERGVRLAFLRSAPGRELGGFALGVARYLLAGALLAWRLG